MTPTLNRRAVLALAAALPLTTQAQIADRTTIVVPYPPGSAPDLLARMISTRLATATGKTVIVDNRPGANAIIGSDYVSKSKPDGTTLLLVDRMTVVVNPLLYAKLPYDPTTLQGITDIARINLVLSVPADAPYKSWSQFVFYAKANPGGISVGSGGQGSVHHLSLELMRRAIGAEFVHVPYKGITPAVQDMLSGQVSAVISGPEVVKQHVASGKLRVLAVGGDRPSPLFPDVPTLVAAGIKTPVLLPTTFTLFAPATTPGAALAPLAEAARKVLRQPDLASQLADLGLAPTPSTPQDIKAAVEAQRGQLTAVIREGNIRLD
jgi:tripartite-type tricarboxylate transporter receptor subunit TctC